MSLADEIDGPAALEKPASRPRPVHRVRHVVYPQLIAVILSVLFGQCEVWGYADVLETGMLGGLFAVLVPLLGLTATAFPIVMVDAVQDQEPRRITTWLAVPLSIAMSFTQILALMPLVS